MDRYQWDHGFGIISQGSIVPSWDLGTWLAPDGLRMAGESEEGWYIGSTDTYSATSKVCTKLKTTPHYHFPYHI